MLVTDWLRNQHRHSQTSCLGVFSASFCQVTGPSRIQGQPWQLWALSWNIFVVVCLFVWPEYCSFIFLKNVASGYLEVRLWEVQELPVYPWERSAMKPFPGSMKPFPDSSTEPKPYVITFLIKWNPLFGQKFSLPPLLVSHSLHPFPLFPSPLSLLCVSTLLPVFETKSHQLKMVPDWP